MRLCFCCTAGFGLLALLLLPALRGSAEGVEVARYIHIQHVRAGEIAWALGINGQYGVVDATGRQAGSLKEFLPVGITEILTFETQNALLVKANSPEAIDEFEALLRLLDQPVKMVYLDALLVTVKASAVKALGPYMTLPGDDGKAKPPMLTFQNKEALGTTLGNLVLNTGARVVNAQRVGIPNGEQGFIDFNTLLLPIRGLLGIAILDVTIHPDNTITLGYDAIGLKQHTQLRLRNNEIVLIPLPADPAGAADDDNRLTILLFLNPTVAEGQFNVVTTMMPNK